MLVAESRMRMGAEEPLKRRSDFATQEWPAVLVNLAWSKISEGVRATMSIRGQKRGLTPRRKAVCNKAGVVE